MDRLKLLKHSEEDHICHMFNTINNYPKDWVIQHWNCQDAQKVNLHIVHRATPPI